MNPRALLAVGIRVLALWLLVGALLNVHVLAWMGERWEEFEGPRILAYTVAELAAAVLIWIFAHPLARRLLGSRSVGDPADLSSAADLERVAAFCIGLYLLVTAAPAAVHRLVLLDRTRALEGHFPRLTPHEMASTAEVVVRLLLAVWLLRGAPGLRGLRPRGWRLERWQPEPERGPGAEPEPEPGPEPEPEPPREEQREPIHPQGR